VDKYVITPNRIHIILLVQNGIAKDGRLIIARTISTVIQQLKRYISKQAGFAIWQKLFHDHIIETKQNTLKYANTSTQIHKNGRIIVIIQISHYKHNYHLTQKITEFNSVIFYVDLLFHFKAIYTPERPSNMGLPYPYIIHKAQLRSLFAHYQVKYQIF
jgi:phage-related holin